MAKIQITKPKNKSQNSATDNTRQVLISRYELRLPGLGRMRTSCHHENFHTVAVEKEKVIKTRTAVTRSKVKEVEKVR